MSKSKSMDLDYPMNLLDAIAKLKYETYSKGSSEWEYPVPNDIDASVEYVLALFKEREADMLHMHYKYGMTFTDIAKEYDITSTRVGQIVRSVLYKLGHPQRMRWLINGVQVEMANRVAEVREKAITEQMQVTYRNIAEIAEKMSELTGNAYFKQVIAKQAKSDIDINTSINVLDLSVRSYNALVRAGIMTVEDLISRTPESLKTLHNLGAKSMDEIIDKVHMHGLLFNGE